MGKTNISLLLAEVFNTEILSCDARQFYREIRIGTSAPNKQMLDNIQHHFIGNLTIWKYYSAGDYQKDALKKLNELFTRLPIVLMVGGSGLYGKVITNGINYLPFIAKEISKDLFIKNPLQKELKKKYVELNRFLRSLGVLIYSNRSFSSYHKKMTKSYYYHIMKIGLNISRDILYKRLNQRIVYMMKIGLLEEAQECYYFSFLNALQTIAYSDIFNYFDGKISFEKALEEIKKNTKRYAKRQLTWDKKEKKLQWFFSYKENEIIENVKKKTSFNKRQNVLNFCGTYFYVFCFFIFHYFMAKGTIHVTAENIFPIIKKFLYSDKEIFLREIVSNAVDATLKFKKLSQLGEAKEEITDTKIEIKINKKEKTLHIIDEGIGMSIKEIDKYINKIAFSGAEEFLAKYKDQEIIGQFGLGFYSAFMVSDRVEIFSKSYLKEIPSAYWSSDGSPIFSLEEGNKKERGTEIVLSINKDSKEFLDEARIHSLLKKYCKFMPVPIKFGDSEEKETKIKTDNIINDPTPVWTKNPLLLRDGDYKKFYSNIFHTELDDPLFWIHLNIDHPFNLTGILYFPKIKDQIEIHKKKIHLYKNQVFVTDNVEGIMPEFLHLLRGIIDSPDIPLNVSRSNLQADEDVKKISGYIIRKVADKLFSKIKNDRSLFEKKWDDIKIIIEHGMLSEEKFFKKANDFFLYKTVDGHYFTFDEFTEKIQLTHKNKENSKLIYLYSSNKETQHSYIKSAKDKSYEVLLLDSPLAPHLIQKLEVNNKDIFFTRVDSDTIENFFKREEITFSKLSENEKEKLKKILSKTIDTHKFSIFLEPLESRSFPFIITNPEFIRRMKDMSKTGVYKNAESLPDIYHLKVNINNEFIRIILKESNPSMQKQMIEKSLYLAMLSKNILTGEHLSKFVDTSFNELLYNH